MGYDIFTVLTFLLDLLHHVHAYHKKCFLYLNSNYYDPELDLKGKTLEEGLNRQFILFKVVLLLENIIYLKHQFQSKAQSELTPSLSSFLNLLSDPYFICLMIYVNRPYPSLLQKREDETECLSSHNDGFSHNNFEDFKKIKGEKEKRTKIHDLQVF